MVDVILTINKSDEYKDISVSAPCNKAYVTINTSDWIDKPWMFYELPALKFEIYTETDGELLKYQNFTREIRTYNPVYSPLGVLNVTIDIRNVPEEFILRITPIFDNNAVAARNMLIENGIEDGDIWGSDQDVPTQLFNLNLEFIECKGEYIPPTPPVPPTHEETITGVPPIAFDGSTGEPLVSWTILGNGQQNGTPSPQNIVPFDGTGERTGNFADTEKGGISTSDGSETAYSSTQSQIRSQFIPCVPNSTYCIGASAYPFNGFASFYASDKSYLSRTSGTHISKPREITTPENAAYIRISLFYASDGQKKPFDDGINIMLNLGSTALPYEPYGYKIPLTCAGQTTPVYLGQTQTTRRVKKLVLTGEEAFVATSSGSHYRCRTTIAPKAILQSSTSVLSTHYFTSSGARDGSIVLTTDGGSVYFTDDTNAVTAETFKSYLAAQYANGTPVTVWYALAEPETAIVNEPLYRIGDYCDELHSSDAAVTIPTAKGQNTMTVDTSIQPSEMTITYTKERQ